MSIDPQYFPETQDLPPEYEEEDEVNKVHILLVCFMQNKNIILKAYSTQKVGSGGNFESGNQGYAADGKYKLTI